MLGRASCDGANPSTAPSPRAAFSQYRPTSPPAFGQPYVAVKNDITERVLSHVVPSMASYARVLQAYVYRRSFPSELYAPSRRCLEEAVIRDPAYAEA